MRKKGCRTPECITAEQALWLACIAIGLGMLLSLILCHFISKCLIAAALIGFGIWRLCDGRR